MGYQDFISESEAENISGVSTVTLNRFVEAGYLRLEVDGDGVRLFSKSELEDLFGLTKFSPPSFEGEEPLYRGEVLDAPAPEETKGTAEVNPVEIPPAAEIPSPSHPHTPTPRPSQALWTLEREVERLKNLSNLQEKIIELREREIADLRDQRDWIKSRFEKLEEKSERDQLILVSVSETNRGLVTALEHRKSPVKAALEWLGLIPETKEMGRTQTLGSTIEVSKS